MFASSKEIGIDIQQKLSSANEKISKVNDDLYDIDDELKRSVKIIGRTLRSVLSNKYLWGFLTLILICVAIIIGIKMK